MLGTSVICEVVLKALRMYGPLPAPAEADELRKFSAVSAVDALAASEPPCALTSFELTMPVDGLARIAGSWVAGVVEVITTPYLPAALTVTPASRKAGLPFRLTSRSSDQTTSAEVSGVPSAKWTFLFSWNVKTFALFVAFQDDTSNGIGFDRLPPLYVNSVSYRARSMIDAVGSNARCGSDVLIVNELSTTSVGAPVACPVAP